MVQKKKTVKSKAASFSERLQENEQGQNAMTLDLQEAADAYWAQNYPGSVHMMITYTCNVTISPAHYVL
jgi:hypothetical protein